PARRARRRARSGPAARRARSPPPARRPRAPATSSVALLGRALGERAAVRVALRLAALSREARRAADQEAAGVLAGADLDDPRREGAYRRRVRAGAARDVTLDEAHAGVAAVDESGLEERLARLGVAALAGARELAVARVVRSERAREHEELG